MNKLKHFIGAIELYLNMYKPTERIYMTTYYYDTERITWFTKTVFYRKSITYDWAIREPVEEN